MKSIDDQLQELYLELRRKEKIALHMSNLSKKITQREEELALVEKDITKEGEELQQLEEVNLYSIFKFVLGNKEKQLEKERQEYLQLFLKKKGLIENLSALRKERELMNRMYVSRSTIEEEFKVILEKKEVLLKKGDGYPPLLNACNERIASFKTNIRESAAAVAMGNTARKHLHRVILNLGRVDVWGYPTKHHEKTKLNNAISRVHKDIYVAQKYLQKYEDELQDISTHFDYDYQRQVALFDQMIDQFIDGLITDWVVKNEIINSLNILNNVVDKISRINSMLECEIEKNKRYIKDEERVKAEIMLEM